MLSSFLSNVHAEDINGKVCLKEDWGLLAWLEVEHHCLNIPVKKHVWARDCEILIVFCSKLACFHRLSVEK